jgi:hypothetical protein
MYNFSQPSTSSYPRRHPFFKRVPTLVSISRGSVRRASGCVLTGYSEVITLANTVATGIETVPFQNPSRNSTRKRLIFQRPSRAISVFQKDLFLKVGLFGNLVWR